MSRSAEKIRREDVRLPVHPLCMIFSKAKNQNHGQCKHAALHTTRCNCARDPVGKSWGRNVSGRQIFDFYHVFLFLLSVWAHSSPQRAWTVSSCTSITIADALAPSDSLQSTRLWTPWNQTRTCIHIDYAHLGLARLANYFQGAFELD